MTALEMKSEICKKLIEACRKQMALRESLTEGSEERIKETWILEGLLRATSIATD